MTGDLNIDVNDTIDPSACEFLDLLVSMDLKQHVKGSTHEGGHSLDLVITREHDDVIILYIFFNVLVVLAIFLVRYLFIISRIYAKMHTRNK